MILLREVRRLPAAKTVVALYTFGSVSHAAFYAVVCEWLDEHGVAVRDYPDDDAIYNERWREGFGRQGWRIVRCGPEFGDSFEVTGIDLKKWTRGRMPAQQKAT